MGRIEHFWREAFTNSGIDFIHIGLNETKKLIHKALFPHKAYRYYKSLNCRPVAFIAHEPASGVFVNKDIPCFVESHGIERRSWEDDMRTNDDTKKNRLPLKTRLLYPIWRLSNCDKGLKYATKILVSNLEDKEYVQEKYQRSYEDVYVFKNGVIAQRTTGNSYNGEFTILFNGSWIERKGIYILIEAAEILFRRKMPVNYTLIGTGYDAATVLANWPPHLRNFVKVVSHFQKKEEQYFLSSASVVVLPSYYEGQPLSLLQAMASGKCCITTNCCGQKDLINNGANGMLFERGDSETLASLLEKCYHNPALTASLGEAAEKSMSNRNWNTVSAEIANFVLSNLR